MSFSQRGALFKEPVEADSPDPKEISEEDMVSVGTSDRFLGLHV
jgi:hypothetical protein